MNITVIGTGYVGLVTGTCFAEMGNDVKCLDIDEKKITALKNGIIPIYEPNLADMVTKNIAEKRLSFTTDYSCALPDSDICFIAVGTPPGEDGSADLSYVTNAAGSIAAHLRGYTVIVNKSTVPVGTAEQVRAHITEILAEKNSDAEFDVVSNPEFLKEGVAIDDFMRPDRIVIGTDSPKAKTIMQELYEPFTKNGHPILFMDAKSAEITKYAANAMLATRISFMNEIARLCDRVGADVNSVRIGIGTDSRIGMSFLYAGGGYGGSCFPKDVKELAASGRRNGVPMKIASVVEEVNNEQKKYIVGAITSRFGNDLKGRTFGMWGLAFKPQTDDMREAPSSVIISELIKRGGKIKAYDPKAMKQAHIYIADYNNDVSYAEDMWTAVEGCDAMILATEWKQFRQPDFERIKSSLKFPVIFDIRNQYDPEKMKALSIDYYCIGRNCYVR